MVKIVRTPVVRTATRPIAVTGLLENVTKDAKMAGRDQNVRKVSCGLNFKIVYLLSTNSGLLFQLLIYHLKCIFHMYISKVYLDT